MVTLKDLSNTAAKGKGKASRNDIKATVRVLQNEYGATVRLLVKENNELRALYFHDKNIRRI